MIKTCPLTKSSHHCPPFGMSKATMPETPKDHNAIHQSMTNTNAYAILITSGSSHSILTAFCSTSIVKGNLAKINPVTSMQKISVQCFNSCIMRCSFYFST